ncbi:hypothetical protein IKG29_00380 [Candidatus Saccharibacteria bacterium]|nr:hypothetical protein [Candidatus Saccharibacteria bacterium]
MDSFVRFLLYLVVLGFSFSASVVIDDISWNWNPTVFRSVKAAKKLAFFYYVIAILIGAVAIIELTTSNFNEWIYMKISFYLFTWFLPIYVFVDLEDHKVLDVALGMAVLSLAVFLVATTIYGFCYQ